MVVVVDGGQWSETDEALFRLAGCTLPGQSLGSKLLGPYSSGLQCYYLKVDARALKPTR